MPPMKLGLILATAATTAAVALASPAREAQAFCGFYVSGADATLTNDATLVVMMRDGERDCAGRCSMTCCHA